MPNKKQIELTMMSPDHLVSKSIRLRNFTDTDAPVLLGHLKDPRITRYTHIPHPYTLEYARHFLRRVKRVRRNGNGIVFAIEELSSGKLIGAIGIMQIDWPSHKAEFGYWLARSQWGKGVMTEAVRLFQQFAFDTLKLNRLHAHVLAPNLGSQKVLKKCGFVYEGTLRQSEFRRRRWLDNLCFAMLAGEYKKLPSARKLR